MAFISRDSRCGGLGAVKLFNNWPSTVYKYDTSSFYNWEQDNEPIYDLDDRTKLLWERAGMPTSSVAGVTFVLSGSNPLSLSNVVTSIPDLEDIIPNVIRFPVAVEIAVTGLQGILHFKNLKMEGTGCLEIINRQFGQGHNTSSVVTGRPVGDGSKRSIIAVCSLDLYHTINDSSAVSVSTSIGAAATGAFDSWNRSFAAVPGRGITSQAGGATKRTDRLSFGANDDNFFAGTAGSINFNLWASAQDPTIAHSDIFVSSQLDAGPVAKTEVENNDPVNILAYGNAFSGVVIENCDGPFYLRGIMVDGYPDENALDHAYETSVGFNIVNSNVVLENCAAARCMRDGFRITGSRVIATRGLIAYRNYGLSSATARVPVNDDQAAGIKLINSEFIVSSDDFVSAMGGNGVAGQNLNHPLANNNFFALANNAIGIRAINSTIYGGQTSTTDSQAASYDETYFQTYQNFRYGLWMTDSNLELDGRLDVFHNLNGILAENSKLLTDKISIERNQFTGMELQNSRWTYGKTLNRWTQTEPEQNYFVYNGQHIVADNSRIGPVKTVHYPAKIGYTRFEESHGVAREGPFGNATNYQIPAVEAHNNSLLEFMHVLAKVSTNTNAQKGPLYGSLFSARNNSKIILRGSSKTIANNVNMLIGPATSSLQYSNAAVYAGSNSEIELTGPNKIAQFGIDLLAEDNSKITLGPPRTANGSLDGSGWLLDDPLNHSKYELHASRACIVVNRNSVLEMRDLGDYNNNWNRVGGAAAITNPDVVNKGYSATALVASGYCQFYPNPPTVLGHSYAASGADMTTALEKLVDWETQGSGHGSPLHPTISQGGVCVRATQGSKIYVENVNFPMGVTNTSGPFYDSHGGNCSKLFIWNIADNSELHATRLSVSGIYPSLVGYHGPSSTYSSGGETVYNHARGAPLGQPDVGLSSFLDIFGPSGDSGVGNMTNHGCFRLYLSPSPFAKYLTYVSATTATGGDLVYGPVYQTLAQGYNPSGGVSSLSGSPIYGIGRPIQATVPGDNNSGELPSPLYLSGFYFASAMLPPDSASRIWLDESAADTFANAKHLAVNKYGTGSFVTIYEAKTAQEGEGHDSNKNWDEHGGAGFFSANIFDLTRQN